MMPQGPGGWVDKGPTLQSTRNVNQPPSTTPKSDKRTTRVAESKGEGSNPIFR